MVNRALRAQGDRVCNLHAEKRETQGTRTKRRPDGPCQAPLRGDLAHFLSLGEVRVGDGAGGKGENSANPSDWREARFPERRRYQECNGMVEST